jgi:hypothetical protein
MIRSSRGLSALAGGVAAVKLSATMTTAAAQGSPSAAASSPAAVADRGSVLQSDYGKARSRVKGTFGKNGVVKGTFTPRKFVARNGKLMVVGLLDATLTKASGAVVTVADQRVKLPVRLAEGQPVGARAAAGCDILNLVLGPLDLNLLGLEVRLDRVVLDIIATPGAGNLLGNLLCAVAGLLDGAGFLTQISQILNSILAILRL